jgi:hypothetical protein
MAKDAIITPDPAEMRTNARLVTNPARDEDVDGTLVRHAQAGMGGTGDVGQDGIGPTCQQRGATPSSPGQRSVPDRVDLAVDPVDGPAADATRDRATPCAEIRELGAREDSVSAGCELGDRLVDRMHRRSLA